MRSISRFFRAINGNTGAMFALCSALVMGGAGVAVDYSRKVDWQTQLQAAVDGAALAAATAEDSDRKKVSKSFFEANFKSDESVKLKKL